MGRRARGASSRLTALGLGALAAAAFAAACSRGPSGPPWDGSGEYRARIVVDPQTISDDRTEDESVAELVIDWPQVLAQLGLSDRRPDLSTLRVVVEPDPAAASADGKAGSDARPFRWYDAAIPYEFGEHMRSGSQLEDTTIPRETRVRAGEFYAAIGDWRAGRLAWTHTQRGTAPSRYMAYFDLLPAGAEPEEREPRGWVGDGSPRAGEWGETTTGSSHTLIALDDWDEDGLVDIVFGEDYGHLFWMRNRGTAQAPRFPSYRMILGADAQPIDAGFGLSPLIIDWDGDGVKDVLAGTHWNRTMFFKNEGTNQDRRLVYRGFVQADGEPLALPIRPIVGRPANVFREDYYPVFAAVDWDADGDVDLVAGGYVTGRIFLYEQIGRDAQNLPVLRFRGPIEADGKPINVGDWCASPAVADLDGDGDLDMVAGGLPMRKHATPSPFLRYYENVGTRTAPVFRERPFPKAGDFPKGHLALPRIVDWDGDGVLDLIVSASQDIFLFRNTGTKTEPRFAVSDPPLRVRSGNVLVPGSGAYAGTQFIDWDGNGTLDAVTGYTAWLKAPGSGVGAYERSVNLLPPGVRIAHSSDKGDDWFWPQVYDLDLDGARDVMFGDWSGHIWWHRNLGTASAPSYDLKGVQLRLTTGALVQVGPTVRPGATSFSLLQGARTVFAVADFDKDGRPDLVVGDDGGVVRHYRHEGTLERPVFAPPVEIAGLKSRLMVNAADWNGDGWPDVIIGMAGTRPVYLRLNTGQPAGSDARFAEMTELPMPPIIEPRAVAVDLNGDGDMDVFMPSTQGSSFVERSFLERGYAPARLIAIDRRPD